MVETERRRRRPPLSCIQCRKRKIKCNREPTCSNCMRSKNSTCVYENDPSQPSKQNAGCDQTSDSGLSKRAQEKNDFSVFSNNYSSTSRPSTIVTHAPSSLLAPSSVPTPPSQISAQDVEFMQNRIKKLEDKLSKISPASSGPSSVSPLVPTPNSTIDTVTSCIGGVFHFHHETHLQGQAPVLNHSVMHKSRWFGQSHWITGLFELVNLFNIFDSLVRDESSDIMIGLQKCKYLGRAIKKQREPSWPCSATSELPPKHVTDELVDCYLRTLETTYRIFHIPSFKRDYEAVWMSDKPDTAFLVQLKLVLAIGATVYDDQYSMRTSAIRWIYEAQSWISEPEFKPRLTIQNLQTNILLLVAREVANIGQGLVWVSVGELLRKAMLMGLHRDPSLLPRKPHHVFVSEMRRRLWNTILEMSLHSSLSSGGPPLISCEDFDTESPGNFDDEHLMAEDPQPANGFTQISIAISLRKTFPVRLAIVKFLNSLGSHGTYEDALRLDSELRESYKTMCQSLQGYDLRFGSSSSQFSIRQMDCLIHRYLLAIHSPYLRDAFHENKIFYAFSRKVSIESSLKMWYAIYPPSTTIFMDGQSCDDASPPYLDDMMRIATCGSGFFRIGAAHAAFIIGTEILSQLEDDESFGFGSIALRPDFLGILDHAQKWSLQCLKIGETNMKGYLFLHILGERVNGLMRRLPAEEFPRLLLKSGEEAVKIALAILEDNASQCRVENSMGEISGTPINIQSTIGEDLNFMMPDDDFSFGNTDPMTWIYQDDNMQEPLLW
ncbi:hypothetical protein BGW36DRAFT_401452 [Talaromyces proteolyticus]|uniref:Zn(2)-C6 fungal-type domain-containing protein n=1 Tax=Talaromyces proteolyticus TaxID=1131652 RepID=A0AAD4PUY8_9EURO|nr:uncharacterized protein BGW36DRAFT_401452 [Talaromyces proteolyticus]KAH8689996.1 hypothetical protein BGW36DRAFT_401452 [Talaromyces proteolyticus]